MHKKAKVSGSRKAKKDSDDVGSTSNAENAATAQSDEAYTGRLSSIMKTVGEYLYTAEAEGAETSGTATDRRLRVTEDVINPVVVKRDIIGSNPNPVGVAMKEVLGIGSNRNFKCKSNARTKARRPGDGSSYTSGLSSLFNTFQRFFTSAGEDAPEGVASASHRRRPLRSLNAGVNEDLITPVVVARDRYSAVRSSDETFIGEFLAADVEAPVKFSGQVSRDVFHSGRAVGRKQNKSLASNRK